MKLGNIGVSYVELMVSASRSLGWNCDDNLARYQIDSTVLSSSDARISIPKFMRLGHDIIHSGNIPQLGLEMGRVANASHLGVAGILAMCAPNIREACRAFTRYELLTSYNTRGQSEFYQSREQGVLQFYSISPYNQFNYFVVDYVLSGWLHLLQGYSNNCSLATLVEFEFEPPNYAKYYEDYFDTDVKFSSDRNAILFSADRLDTPLQNHCASTYAGMVRLADTELDKVRRGYTFKDIVERAIGPLLNGQTPSIKQVAKKLNIASWTLSRRLSNENSSFQEVLNETRRELAVSYVRDTNLTLGEIAYLVGFGSATAFQRAFKRWTGQAPGQYREQSCHDKAR